MNIKVLLVIISCLFIFSCSSEIDKSSSTTNETADMIKRSIREDIKYKVSLVCLKNNIENEQFVDEIVDLFASVNLLYNFDTYTEEHKKKLATFDSVLSKRYEHLDRNIIDKISKKFNVPASTIASIIYDYELLAATSSNSE